MVAQCKREKEEKLSFIGTSVFAPVHYGLVHSILPPNQSVRSGPGAHDKGQQQAPTMRTIVFLLFHSHLRMTTLVFKSQVLKCSLKVSLHYSLIWFVLVLLCVPVIALLVLLSISPF